MSSSDANTDSDSDFEMQTDNDSCDSEEEFSCSDEDEEIEACQFGEWRIITDPFSDTRDTSIYEKEFEYDIHPAIDMNETKSAKDFFEAFVSQKVVGFLCRWTNERALMHLEENNNLALKIHGIYWTNVQLPEMYTFILLLNLNTHQILPNACDA
ncbi:hypothetical protein QE152_g29669 [Popillia japonica]|uniref:Uncharacterized protein n=1 Tax=Popillia japonica TaxID=7064 RepID=A0AAW1JG98_POPJA